MLGNLKSSFGAGRTIDPQSASRRWRWRMFRDVGARYFVAVGGIGVIIAILLIFFYLLYVVLPLFQSAGVSAAGAYEAPGGVEGQTLHLAMEEQAEIGVRFTRDGRAVFFKLADGSVIDAPTVTLPKDAAVTSFSAGTPGRGVVAFGLSNGQAVVAKHGYKVTFPNDVRLITPHLEYPAGEAPLLVDPFRRALTHVAVRSGDDQTTVAAATDDGRLVLHTLAKKSSFLDDTETWEGSSVLLPSPQMDVSYLLLDPEQRVLYTANTAGELSYYDISDKESPRLVQRLRVVAPSDRITALEFLAGGFSLIVGDNRGRLTQWFPVRDERNNYVLTRIRAFESGLGTVTALAPEYSRKGFLAADSQGRVGIYHATADRTLLETTVATNPLSLLAVAPRADAMLAQDAKGMFHFWHVHNEHPEVSWSALWGKVWYEGYNKPDYIWQSSAATSDFEPKFSLTPLAFGSMKAAFYAMLLAAPLAILAAIYTAHFMAPRMRRVVKPSVEIMEALPTVILGFLAGLWLAPFVERHMPGIFSLLLVMPIGLLLAAYLWTQLPGRVRHWVPEGWEGALLIPVVLLVGWVSIAVSPGLEEWLFGGDMRKWLTNEMGVDFDQRNSIIVGLAMGFAVIPMMFSIAEDAIFGVPKQLTQGSLALGATPWQTMWRVVLLTASPGIFSAVMIGFGRAVGETMIVLMATGNTPVMDFSLFQGMRTLSANIAVEMPESEVNSTHFRVLFLAALVLFLLTFVFNTVAEVVRQRLRRKYSSL